jgi:FYVE, RhoGEF and PH domain containing 5/6
MSFPLKVPFPSTQFPFSSDPLATHLPFRRMSLPAPPSLNLNRQSVVSLVSFESLSEHGTPATPVSSPTNKSRSGRTSIEVHRKGVRRRGHRAPDEDRGAKRRKIIEEFYETERTYVQGLDLIYEVCLTSYELLYDLVR